MGKKTDVTVKRLSEIQELTYKAGLDVLECNIDPIVVSCVIDGLVSGIECVKLILDGKFSDTDNSEIANGMVDGTLLASLIKLTAMEKAGYGGDTSEVIDEMLDIVGKLSERGQ